MTATSAIDRLKAMGAGAASSGNGKAPEPPKPPKMKTPAPAKAPPKGKGFGRLGKTLAGGLATVARMFYGPRKPLHVAVIERQCNELPDILDRLYEEDEWVRRGVDWVNAKLGKSDAWGSLLALGVQTFAALQMLDGKEIPILGVLAAPLIESALIDAATKCAAQEAREAGRLDAAGVPVVDPERVQWYAHVLSGGAPE